MLWLNKLDSNPILESFSSILQIKLDWVCLESDITKFWKRHKYLISKGNIPDSSISAWKEMALWCWLTIWLTFLLVTRGLKSIYKACSKSQLLECIQSVASCAKFLLEPSSQTFNSYSKQLWILTQEKINLSWYWTKCSLHNNKMATLTYPQRENIHNVCKLMYCTGCPSKIVRPLIKY